jgi:hypothetical protein
MGLAELEEQCPAYGRGGRVKKKAILWSLGTLLTALSFIVLLPAAVRAQDPNSRGDALGMTIETRFPTPPGFARGEAADDSFAAYLRRLPLKPHGTAVKLFDGRSKPNPGIYAAVVDLPIGRRDLHQCADAIIRLRADYLFSRRRYDEIRFRFTNGFPAEYSRWRRGERIALRGSHARWVRTSRSSDSPRDYWLFLETVFSYAGTASLARELAAAPGDDPRSGDIFIQPGHPGHAVIVVDSARSRADGRGVFLLAQSYMPAQEIQVLLNPNDPRLSPWYAAEFGEMLVTPEWTFRRTGRKRFLD